MAQIKFLGAAGEVTGSGYLITGSENSQILVDFGIFQGSEELENLNYTPLTFDPSKLSAVLLTHAHLDHCGRLPLITKSGFTGQVFTTEPTQKITEVSLLDSAAIAAEDPRHPALYTAEDVNKLIASIVPVKYNQPFSIKEFTVTFRNAGHILGSASIEIKDSHQVLPLVISGDLGNTPEDLIQPTENIVSAGTVVIESTYGNSAHPVEDVHAIIKSEINAIENSGGTLLIPAFSIERAQEIIHDIGHLIQNNDIRPQTPIFLDSPMAIEVTEIFKKFPYLYSPDLAHDSSPFDFPSLICTKRSEDSRKIFKNKQPKVIIAGSGMMSGGRIMHHLVNYISNSTTRILIVGYQAEGTLGREIESGASEVIINKKHLPVKATVTKLESLSSHADQPKLMKWLGSIKNVTKVFVVHGENLQREALSAKIKSDLGMKDIILPLLDQTFEF